MNDVLDNTPKAYEGPTLIIRKAPHVSVWSVWAILEGTHSEELFEASSEEEASNWIKTGAVKRGLKNAGAAPDYR